MSMDGRTQTDEPITIVPFDLRLGTITKSKAYYLHFSIFSYGSHFVHQSGTIPAISVESDLSNMPMKFE